MIHLIDRIYLEYAEAKPLPANPLIKPEAYIYIVDRGLSGVVDHDTQDKNLFNAKTVLELYKKFGSPENLISHLIAQSQGLGKKKIVIYADEIATIQLLCSLWKGIYPKITANGAYQFYQTYKDFEAFKPKDQVDFIALGEDSREVKKSYFFDRYWGQSFEVFQKIFDSIPGMKLSNDFKEKLGTEHLMIKYMLQPEADHKILGQKIDHFYKKNLMKEILGLKSIASEYIYTILASEEDNIVELSDGSAYDRIKKHPKWSLLLDDKITYSISGYDHLKSNYNLIKVCYNLTNAEAIAFRSMGIEPEKKDTACCYHIIENHLEPDLKTIIDDECFYGSNFRLFRELAKKGRYNQYLVYAVASTLKARGKESLSEFSE